jgi:hypothetical protein
MSRSEPLLRLAENKMFCVSTVYTGDAELPIYDKYYPNYKIKRLVFGAIVTDSSAFDVCAEKL